MAIFSILLSVTLAAIFKHGSRFISKIVNFRKMSLTFDKIHLSTCKWAQIIHIKILWYALYKHLLCQLHENCKLMIKKLNFEGFSITFDNSCTFFYT